MTLVEGDNVMAADGDIVGCSVDGAFVTPTAGASVGAFVGVLVGTEVGKLVAGAIVDGAKVVGAIVDGANVDGAIVAGAIVVGSIVDGAMVVGALVGRAPRIVGMARKPMGLPSHDGSPLNCELNNALASREPNGLMIKSSGVAVSTNGVYKMVWSYEMIDVEPSMDCIRNTTEVS